MACMVIGDIHGRRIWETIVANHPEETIVFLGDYFDSKEGHTAKDQLENFQKIIALKKANPAKTILLTGNHDFHYLPFAGETYGGYQEKHAREISAAIMPVFKEGLLQMGYRCGNFLINHAGLTKTWCRTFNIPLNDPIPALETLWKEKPISFRYHPGPKMEPTGDEREQGPLWVRPYSLQKDKLPGFWQVVGHTQQPAIEIGNKIILADCLGFTPQYLEITQAGLAFAHYI
jgi:hypothetical protein